MDTQEPLISRGLYQKLLDFLLHPHSVKDTPVDLIGHDSFPDIWGKHSPIKETSDIRIVNEPGQRFNNLNKVVSGESRGYDTMVRKGRAFLDPKVFERLLGSFRLSGVAMPPFLEEILQGFQMEEAKKRGML